MRFSAACSSSLAAALLAIAAYAEEPREPAGFSLAELMDGMASTSGVMADFHEQKQIALLEKPLESSGKIYFVPPNRLVRFTLKPESSALIIDGEKLRFQQGDREEFDLSGNPMARIFIDNFIVLFNGDLPKLQELYHTNFDAEGENWTLILEPRKSPLRGLVKEIELRGDRKGIREMVMQNTDGDRTSTTLDLISTDHHFTDDQLEELFIEGAVPTTVIIR
jgi:outer membrane lipoprotein-sorting protein